MRSSVRLTKIAAALTLSAFALSACAPEFNPPPDYRGGFLWDSDKSRTVTVAVGDTIYGIARRYNVPARAIIARNGLTAPYALTVGQSLILDPARVHTVVRGDTLSQLAVTYNVEMRLIASVNDLQSPYVIRIGQELWIPDPFSIAAAPTARPGEMTVAQVEPVQNQAPVMPRAPTSDIRAESLPPLPGTPEPLPPAQAEAPTVAPEPAAPVIETAPTPAPASPPAPAIEPAPAPEPDVIVPPGPIAEPPARASARFSWPLRGKIIGTFGAVGAGLHNDGINIAAPLGSQVRAADHGVVAYAGSELKGFGNLLLIKHADGWTTAYAHNDKLLVNRGDEVKQGQVVAVVGKTGNVDSPQLHFEVRKGTQAMNPMEFLAK